MHDVAGVNERDGGAEVAGILKKERAQLGEVHGEALIHGELRLIGLNIAEIGIDGAVQDDAVFDDELNLAAGGAFDVPRAEVRVRWVKVDELALVLTQRVGVQLEVVRAGHAFDAAQRGLLGQYAAYVGGHARPVVRLGVAGQIALKDHAPIFLLGVEAEAAKWNGDESHPAFFRHASVGIPNRVVAVVRSVGLAP